MRTWKISNVHVTVLEGLSDGKPLREIARSMGLNHTTVMRHAKQLEQRGYITRQVRSSHVIFSILPSGLSNMHHPVRESLTGGSKHAPPREDDPSKIKIRLHRLQVKYDLVNPVRDPRVISFKDHPSKIVSMGPKNEPAHWSKNIIQFEDFTAIISTRSIIIAGIQRYLTMDENIEVQEARVLSEITPFVEQIEQRIQRLEPGFQILRKDGSGPVDLGRYDLAPVESASYDLIRGGTQTVREIHSKLKERGLDISPAKLNDALMGLVDKGLLAPVGPPQGFQVKRLDRGVLSGKILAREYAFEHDLIADKVKSMTINNEEGKPRIQVDSSKGSPEMEFVDKYTSPQDSEQYKENVKVLATTDLGQTIQIVKTAANVIMEQSKLSAMTQDQLSQLASALGTLSSMVGSMGRP